MSITMKYVQGHVEVYGDGKFLFSADDTKKPAKTLRKWGMPMTDVILIAASPLIVLMATIIITCIGGAIKGAFQGHKNHFR